MKLLKRMISVFLSAVIAFGCLGGLTVNAAAAGEIGYSLDYDYYGTAFLTLTPADKDNYITYTADGTAPKANSEKFTSEICVYSKTMFRVAEFTPSGKRISGKKLTVTPRTANVEFDIEYGNGTTTVELDCPTFGARIYYTTDGSTPTKDSQIYLGDIAVTKKTTIKAIAYKTDMKKSKVISKTVTVKTNDNDVDDEDEDSDKLKAVRYSTSFLADKGYTYITLTPQKKTNVIYYTTDGTAPSKSSAKYKKRIKFTEPTTLRAVEYTAKGEKVAAVKLKVAIKCAPVEFVCTDIGLGTKVIELKTDTKGADIYYTLDGSVPDEEAFLYTGKLTLGDYTRIKAVAIKDGYKKSSVRGEIAWQIPLVLTDFDSDNPIYAQTVAEVNRARAERGLNPLTYNEEITKAACVRAKEISVYNDHVRPTGAGYASVFSDYGITVGMNAEFIATYCETPQELVATLLQEPTCHLVAQGYKYNSIGVGYFEIGKSRYWVILIAVL